VNIQLVLCCPSYQQCSEVVKCEQVIFVPIIKVHEKCQKTNNKEMVLNNYLTCFCHVCSFVIVLQKVKISLTIFFQFNVIVLFENVYDSLLKHKKNWSFDK